MRKLLIASLGLAFLGHGALAADLPLKAAAPRAVADTWAGLYVGLQGGWNLGSFAPFCRACGTTGTEINLDDNNPFIGGHVGYLIQSGGLVIGPELGVQYLGFKSQAELAPAGEVTPAVLLQQKVDWLAYANLRAGFSPFQRTLIYLTGGVAWAHAKGEVLNIGVPIDTSATTSAVGWNLGGGFEFKLWESASLGFEYRHYDFGDVASANPLFAVMTGTGSARLSFEQAMGRLNFKLN